LPLVRGVAKNALASGALRLYAIMCLTEDTVSWERDPKGEGENINPLCAQGAHVSVARWLPPKASKRELYPTIQHATEVSDRATVVFDTH